jgi:hypothetical protein
MKRRRRQVSSISPFPFHTSWTIYRFRGAVTAAVTMIIPVAGVRDGTAGDRPFDRIPVSLCAAEAGPLR